MKKIAQNLFIAGLLTAGGIIAMVFAAITIIMAARSARADAIENLNAAVVKVDNATGSIVQGKSGKQYILTNWHVCFLWKEKNRTTLTGITESGSEINGRIKFYDTAADLCAAQIEPQYFALKTNKDSSTSDVLYTKGYPHGVTTISSGRIIDTKFQWAYKIKIEDVYGNCPKNSVKIYFKDGKVRGCDITWRGVLTNIYSRPGSSGSPVLDSRGNLVSVLSSHNEDASVFSGGIVPFDMFNNFMEKL